MIWPLNKLFGQTTQTARPVLNDSKLLGRSHALCEMLINQQDHHIVRIYLTDIEPREFCERGLMQELKIFLACPGNRLEVYTHPDTLKRYNKLHSFLELVNESAKANLFPVPGDALKQDFMLGSHGQTYFRASHGAGVYSVGNAKMQAKLGGWFEILRGQSPQARPAVLEL